MGQLGTEMKIVRGEVNSEGFEQDALSRFGYDFTLGKEKGYIVDPTEISEFELDFKEEQEQVELREQTIQNVTELFDLLRQAQSFDWVFFPTGK